MWPEEVGEVDSERVTHLIGRVSVRDISACSFGAILNSERKSDRGDL
jgi:hypothetical protein